MTTHKNIATFVLAAFAAIGCEPGGIISESTDSLDVGDGDGDGDMETTGGDGDGDPGDGDGVPGDGDGDAGTTTGDGDPGVGDLWGPCPISMNGDPGDCLDGLSCTSADEGKANICLPEGGCPDNVPLGLFGELGVGGVCYPRCGQDSECMTGQICAMSDDDGGSVCAWPFDAPVEACCPCDPSGTWSCIPWEGGAQSCIDWGYENDVAVTWHPDCPAAQTDDPDDDIAECWSSCA